MSCFNGLKLTKLGEILLANINGNLNETLTFTSGAVGAGAINDENEINSLTALKDKWKDLDILNIEKDEDDETIVKLELQFSNVDLQEAKLFREIGIYAKGNNGEPVLFAYSNAGENYDYVPLPKDNPQTFTIQINLKITSNSKIDAIINMAGFVTIGKMVEFLKSKLTQIPTVIELQSRKNLKVGDIVEVLGYYTAGDGAGHKRIISNEDDGSGVQLANGLWANIVHNGEVNVSWFGAKGDGVTDDTLAIQKLFSSNLASSAFFPKGEYLISSTIKISKFLETYNLKTIKGDRAKIKVNSTFNGEYCFVFDDSEIDSPQMLKISGLSFEGDKTQKGILFNYVQLFYLENCSLRNFIVGIEIKRGYYGTLGKNLNIFECVCGIYLAENSNNSLLIQNVRLTSGTIGILIGSHLGGVSVQNCIIESFKYGIAGTVERKDGGGFDSFINIISNYFENNNKEIYLSRISVSEDFSTIAETNNGFYTVPNCVITNNYFLANFSKGNCISLSPLHNASINSNFGLKKCELLLLRDRMPLSSHTIYCNDELVEFIPVGSIVTGITIYYPNQIVYSGRLHYNKLVRVAKNNIDYQMNNVMMPTNKFLKITNKELLEPLYEAFNANELSSSYRTECKVYINGHSYDVVRKNDGDYLYKDKTELAVGRISEFLKIGVTGEELLFYDVYSKMFISYKDGTFKGTIYAYIDSNDKAFGTEFPLSPRVNQIFYHTTEKKYKIYNGNNWIDI